MSPGAHHGDAVAQADQLHQLGRDDDHGAALRAPVAGSGNRCRAWRRRRRRASARRAPPPCGCGCSTLASASFCWLPPDSDEARASSVAGADAEVLHGLGQRRALGARASARAAHSARSAISVRFSRRPRCDVQALALAVLAQVGEAVAGGVARAADAHRAARRSRPRRAGAGAGPAGPRTARCGRRRRGRRSRGSRRARPRSSTSSRPAGHAEVRAPAAAAPSPCRRVASAG